jgi:transglutaminase-like putative cysteine protease
MSRRLLIVCAVTVGLLAAFSVRADESAAPALDPAQPYTACKSDPVTYQVEFSAVVTPPYHARVLKVWMPIPQTDAAQEVSGSVFSTYPMKVEPKVGTEKVYGNKFAYFEFDHPEGAQVIRHNFTVKTWELRWDVDPAKVAKVEKWPASFAPYLRSERLIATDDRFQKLAGSIVPERKGAAADMAAVIDWVNANLKYSHSDCSLQASALHALERRVGHCSDWHGLCTALGRTLGYPTRVVYGINPTPKNSPSHCKLEAYLPPYGWVCFDVSETQVLIGRINKDASLDEARKKQLAEAARDRLLKGFRDNTWFLQTRGTDYELEPPAKRKAAVVRTIYAEADGEALPEPDPADPTQRRFAWMTVHRYVPDRPVTNPFKDWRSLENNR